MTPVDAPASALLARFAVWGRFYDTTFDGELYALRSHLEIVAHDIMSPDRLRAPADLVAVMMNPGGSRPLQAVDPAGWAPTQPDRTQYQLMKLALRAPDHRPIRHIRVINLSDLRTPKSALLFQTLAKLSDERHSLFAVARAAELAAALGPDTVPVLRAWGLATPLTGLAQRAVAATASRPVLGLTDNGLHYRHPLPQRADLQRAWLDAVALQAL